MTDDDRIPVIDLFAGPGGLGEGFSECRDGSRVPRFRVALSIEKDAVARETLRLRAFYREFACHVRPEFSTVPEQYYEHLRGERDRKALYDFFPNEADAAERKAWLAELGGTPAEQVDERIQEALGGARTWVLIGGPPCQAYSVIGRSRPAGARRAGRSGVSGW